MIDKMQTVMIATSAVDRNQAIISANAMLGMYHQITSFKCTNLAQEVITFTTLGLRPRQSLTKYIRFGDNQNLFTLKANIK